VPRRGSPRTAFGLLLPVLAAALLAQSAGAAEPPPDPSDSALAQYVEQIPTSSGSKAVGRAGDQPAGVPLGASADSQLRAQGGTDADLLEAIATSPALGAPEKKKARSRPTERDDAPTVSEAAGAPAESTASELISGRVVALLAILGGITIAAGLLAARSRRSAEK
jgi:hypothetical protein